MDIEKRIRANKTKSVSMICIEFDRNHCYLLKTFNYHPAVAQWICNG